jgi:hypothetical protein
VTIYNNFDSDMNRINDPYLSSGASVAKQPQRTIEGFDTTAANGGTYTQPGGVNGIIGYTIPYSQKVVIVYFANMGSNTPVSYVYVTEKDSFTWGSDLLDTVKNGRKTSVVTQIKVNGDEQSWQVSVFYRWR